MEGIIPKPQDFAQVSVSPLQSKLNNIIRTMSTQKPADGDVCWTFTNVGCGLSGVEKKELGRPLLAAGWRIEWSASEASRYWKRDTLLIRMPHQKAVLHVPETVPSPKDIEF